MVLAVCKPSSSSLLTTATSRLAIALASPTEMSFVMVALCIPMNVIPIASTHARVAMLTTSIFDVIIILENMGGLSPKIDLLAQREKVISYSPLLVFPKFWCH